MKIPKVLFLIFALLLTKVAGAQPTNGKLSSLLSADNYFSSMVQAKGLKKAFLKVIDPEAIIFMPAPLKAADYYRLAPDPSPKNITWQPTLARIAKSGDWGFISGSIMQKAQTDEVESRYGQYLTVWKVNEKGIWKVALDLGIDHLKPQLAQPALDFRDPENMRYFRQHSEQRFQQREDVVLVNDRLFSTSLFSNGSKIYEEFLADKARLLFPGLEPIIGKEKIMDFWSKHPYQNRSQPEFADRSKSGDWAYTRGTATLNLKDSAETFYYVRIWELQPDYNWNLLLEIYTPAIR